MKSGLMLGVNNNAIREENDFYATNPKAVKILLPILEKLGVSKSIWECSCGQGHISKVLKENGYNVFSSDLIDRGYGEVKDFLSQTEKFNGDILTNPPFKLAENFVEKSMQLLNDGNKAIFLLKIQFLEGQKRKIMFDKGNLKYLIVNSERQQCSKDADFEKYKATTQCYCWFVFEKGYHGESKIMWI